MTLRQLIEEHNVSPERFLNMQIGSTYNLVGNVKGNPMQPRGQVSATLSMSDEETLNININLQL